MKRFISLQRRLFSKRLISTKLLHHVLEVSCSTWIFNPRSGIIKVNIIIQFNSLSLLSSFPFQEVPGYHFIFLFLHIFIIKFVILKWKQIFENLNMCLHWQIFTLIENICKKMIVFGSFYHFLRINTLQSLIKQTLAEYTEM